MQVLAAPGTTQTIVMRVTSLLDEMGVPAGYHMAFILIGVGALMCLLAWWLTRAPQAAKAAVVVEYVGQLVGFIGFAKAAMPFLNWGGAIAVGLMLTILL